MNDEEKEKINEQGDEVTTNDSNSLMRKFRVSFVGSFRLIFFFFFFSQREFDENEVDPYHGQQNKKPEPESMDLPEDLNLDQEEEAGEDEEGEGDGEEECFRRKVI